MRIQVSNWSFPKSMTESTLIREAQKLKGLKMAVPRSLTLLKESIDRRGGKSKFVYTFELDLPEDIDCQTLQKRNKGLYFKELSESNLLPPIVENSLTRKKVIVIGLGPAGTFAAYSLALQGAEVEVWERGTEIKERLKDVRELFKNGTLKEESNICFGEGGAGTFSDGKLTTRKNHPWIRWVKEKLVSNGAPESILTSGKPHIGSDRLRAVATNFRKKLLELGVKIYFKRQATELLIQNGQLKGIVSQDGHKFSEPDAVVWASGHSARDSMKMLIDKGVSAQAKAFAIGFRIEHPQKLINNWQDKEQTSSDACDYSVVYNASDRRGIYSFCMCPGGQIVCSSSHSGFHVVNGMSNYARSEAFANAGLVIKVDEKDFPHQGPLAGMEFQEKLEAKAFSMSQNQYLAPAQRVVDFLNDQTSNELNPTSYIPGLYSAPLHNLLPNELTKLIKEGLKVFERKYPGFAGPEAQLIGLESRTSSPLRIERLKNGQSPTLDGFYPCGEGAGYAGGIVSAALDGLHIAQCIRENSEKK